ncbi:MAG TPA: TonB-dependent receptor plug domain-containing protein [Opitutaceae bacterium]|nr:TonB-dependent receptor plug domain-containing protein [Opitutaceae bacterium]
MTLTTHPRWPLPCGPAIALAAFLAIAAGPLAAQTTPAPAPAATNPKANPIKHLEQSQADVVTLSPFEVSAAQDHGYYSPTTLAGTRLNNNIADLPSSISIVTKQELEDTNSQNINDVFRYEANTEGASTYTPIALVRGNVSDVLGTQLLSAGNRVRGLANADMEIDNFYALKTIPFDSYNTQSVEVDRGPNSILFGTGSPAGIVNQTRARAELDKFSGDASLQLGSWGTLRDTLDVNIPLLKHRLSVYVGQTYNSVGFKQKPSYDITRREYAAFTLVPFASKKTKISGSFEYYNNSADDPNAVTPVDFVTPWRKSGRPVWDPTTDMVTYLSTGQTVGPYAAKSTYPNYAGILQTNLTTASSPYFVPSLTYVSTGGHMVQGINPDNSVTNFFKSTQTGFTVNAMPTTGATAPQMLVNEEQMTWSAPLPTPAGYQIWQAPSVSSKNVYDWSSINLDSMSWVQRDAKTYYLDFQQELLPHLNLDLGWFRQEYTEFNDEPVSQANATTIYVDTNTKLLNGQPNPHLGQPLIDTYASDLFATTERNNNVRASLAYDLDLRRHAPGWLDWVGHHRFMAVASQHDDVADNLRYRESIVGGDPNYLPTAAVLNQASGYGFPLHNTAIEQWYYLGGTGATNGYGATAPGAVRRPGIAGPTAGTITSYDYATSAWTNSTINLQSVLYPSGGLQENVQDTKTYFWQSFFWNDRIVGTLGLNEDWIKNRQNVFPRATPEKYEYTNGFPNRQYWRNYGPWTYDSGKTRTKGLVLHPFKNWQAIDHAADNGNLLAAVARTISLTYNESANFNPPPAAYTDFFGNPLGKPQGREKDLGFEIATPDNKLFIRATWFKTTNENQLVSDTSNMRALYVDANELKSWATAVVEVRNGQDPTASDFGNTSIHPITPSMQQQIADLTKLPYTFGGNVGENGQFINPYETENGIAKGVELEAVYNPLPNWRMKFTWGRQKTIVSNIASQAAAWIAHRYPTWSTYKASDLNTVYTRSNGRQMYLGDFWTGYGYDGNIYQGNVFGWNTTQDYYNIVVAGQLATDRALNDTQATNQRQYTWSFVSSYDFDEGLLKGWTVGGALRYLGKAVAGYYGDATHVNSSGQIYQPDVTRPIYFPAEYQLDAWLAYQFRLPWHNLHAKVQLNVTDLNVHGYLEPVTYNYDGSPAAYRIIQPRSFSLTTRVAF